MFDRPATRSVKNSAILTVAFVLAILLLLFNTSAHAQSRSIHDGYTPTGVEEGAAAGSYPLGGFENINLFNGMLNIAFPLARIGGRGSAGYTMTLKADNHWEVIKWDEFGFNDDASYAAGRSWRVGYGPGRLLGMHAADTTYPPVSPCGPPPLTNNYPIRYLTRLTFIMPDGSEILLHDKLYGGVVDQVNMCNPPQTGRNRDRAFVSADGESMTFISDFDIYDLLLTSELSSEFYTFGNLMMKDGTSYRIDWGRVSWIRDRNGNKVSFTYEPNALTGRLLTVTDSLNRVVSISYAAPSGEHAIGYDEIRFKGFGGAQRSIKIWYDRMQNILYPGETIKKAKQLFPEVYSPGEQFAGEWDMDGIVLSKIELPDQRAYQFLYNSYGEIARIILPTGGGFDYEHTASVFSPVVGNNGNVYHLMIYRRVTKRTVYNTLTPMTDPNNPPAGTREKIENYILETGAQTIVRAEVRDGANVLIAQSKHYFFGDPKAAGDPDKAPVCYSWWAAGKEYKTEIFNVIGGTAVAVLRSTDQIWSPSVTGHDGICYGAPDPNPKIAEIINTFNDTNQVAKQAFGYDQYNNQTDVYEYDFGAGAPGPLIRRTQTTYLTNNPYQGNINYAADLNIHIRNLPALVSIFDGNGNEVSRTHFDYDRYDLYPLQDCQNIVQHDGGFRTGYAPRGNVTKFLRWLLPSTGNPNLIEVATYSQHDIAGNVVKAIDGRTPAGITTFDFGDRFGSPDDDAQSNAGAPELAGGFSYAFPTKVTNALDHTAYIQYDYYLGRPVNSEDANGVVGSVTYNDALDRTTHGIQARYKVGVGIPAERRQTTIAYDDANRVITATSDRDIFNDNILTTKTYYDGLGRTRRGAAREGATWTITDTQFDALGRVSQVSNPYRAADPDSASPPSGPFAEWTTTDYDALGRVIRMTTPDGAQVDTAYSGNQVTVIDQALKKRRSETDALGRLIKITEAPGNLNYETYYSYDALGNLRQVTQGAQARTFAYDSLSRLISATNPESGPMTYAYDPNGNLTEKTEARGVKTAMTYDALNRVRSKVYTGLTPEGTAVASLTPPVNYFYDGYSGLPSGAPSFPGTPSKGRLTGVTYGPGSEGIYYKYDDAGRIVTNHQRMGTSNYVTKYFFNLAGAVTREERGSLARRKNWMSYDAAGRLLAMQTGIFNVFGFEPHDLVRDISYTPFGGLQSETYGNELIHSMAYNSRHQPTEIRLGIPNDLESIFRIGYIYGTADNVNVQDGEITAAHNNGNISTWA